MKTASYLAGDALRDRRSEIESGKVVSDSIYSNYYEQHVWFLDLCNRSIGRPGLFRVPTVIGLIWAIFAFFLSVPLFGYLFIRLLKSTRSIRADCSTKTIGIATCKTSENRLLRYQVRYKRDLLIIRLRSDARYLSHKDAAPFSDGIGDAVCMFSLYEFLKLSIFSARFYSGISNCFLGFVRINKNDFSTLKFSTYCGLRFLNDSLIECMAAAVIDKTACTTVVAGTTNERAGYILTKLCEAQRLATVCVPHGSAPSIKLPAGLFGHTYFALSLTEQKILTDLYPDRAVLFDEELVKEFYCVRRSGCDFSSNERRGSVVFATSSRDVAGDQEIIYAASSSLETLGVKLHPSDSISLYNFPSNCHLIETIDEMITFDLLICAPSAITYEAIYNDMNAWVVAVSERKKMEVNTVFRSIAHPEAQLVTSMEELKIRLQGLK